MYCVAFNEDSYESYESYDILLMKLLLMGWIEHFNWTKELTITSSHLKVQTQIYRGGNIASRHSFIFYKPNLKINLKVYKVRGFSWT